MRYNLKDYDDLEDATDAELDELTAHLAATKTAAKERRAARREIDKTKGRNGGRR